MASQIKTDSCLFTFASAALSADAFGVVEFRGREGLSQCYEFQVLLVSDDAEVDMAAVLENMATLGIHRADGQTVEFHGIVPRFEQLHEVDGRAFYRASLAPRLRWLSLTRHSQVFLNLSVPDIVEACLKDAGLTDRDYEFRLQGSYPALEYACQFDETHLDFISRRLEREGIYYFFEQGDGRDKVVFTDTKISHSAHPQGGAASYVPPSGLGTPEEEEVVRSFNCRCQLLPAGVRVRDYNHRKPSLDVSGKADVDGGGRGRVYHYGDRSQTPEDAGRMARLRAEGLSCRRFVFEGGGSVPYLSPGYTFDLRGHYRKSFDQGYLTTGVAHEGAQAGYLLAGLSRRVEGVSDRVFYRNRFEAVPSGVQYRPERRTTRPKVPGVVAARVDAAGSGKYAELDESGRYKVVMPFDLSGRGGGKASAWVRMATPYAGSDHGVHFPLHKGAEVLLTFRDGDPDRPVIAAAVPNPENPSQVTGANQTASVIRTGSGNRIQLEDKEGEERILLHAPAQSSFIRVGAHNDPPTADDDYKTSTTHWGIAEKTDGWIEIQAMARNEVILGELTDWVVGFRVWFTLLLGTDGVLGGKYDFQWPEVLSFKNLHCEAGADNFKAEVDHEVATAVTLAFHATEKKVAGQVAVAVGEELNALANDNLMIVQSSSSATQFIRTVGQKVVAQTQAINVLGNKIDSAGSSLRTMGSEMRSSGTAMKNSASHTETSGASIESSGAHTRTSGNIMQTAGAILVN